VLQLDAFVLLQGRQSFPVHFRLSKNAVFAGLILTVPCYAFLLFCHGFLPVAALAIVGARLLREAHRDPAALIFVIPISGTS
jgi:hypothetical protein